MSTRYAVRAATPGGDLLTWHGRVLVHGNRDELEFLLAGDIRVVECPRDIPPEQCLELRFHPQLASVKWPLDRKDFR